MSSIKNISLYIPHVFSNYEKEDIKNVFEKLKIGNVKNIDLISKMGKDGKTFNTAYIHFNYWYDTKEATELQENIFNSNKDARLVYDNPWFWIVLENKAKKFVSGERKTRINLGDLLKQEIQLEEQETQPEKREPKKQKPEKKKEQKIQTTQYLPIAPTLNNEEFSFEEIEEIENQILMDELEDEMDDDEEYDQHLVNVDGRYLQILEEENTGLRIQLTYLQNALMREQIRANTFMETIQMLQN